MPSPEVAPGIKSILVIKQMNAEGTKKTLDEGTMIYDGHETDPTIEGPKIYKRNGYYYILAPAGGVSTGLAISLAQQSIYGTLRAESGDGSGRNDCQRSTPGRLG